MMEVGDRNAWTSIAKRHHSEAYINKKSVIGPSSPCRLWSVACRRLTWKPKHHSQKYVQQIETRDGQHLRHRARAPPYQLHPTARRSSGGCRRRRWTRSRRRASRGGNQNVHHTAVHFRGTESTRLVVHADPGGLALDGRVQSAVFVARARLGRVVVGHVASGARRRVVTLCVALGLGVEQRELGRVRLILRALLRLLLLPAVV